MTPRIDAHQHFWKLDRGDYGWLTPDLEPIYRDFLPSDLVPLMEAAGIAASVLVQAAPSEAETHFMLALAEHDPFIAGVVGWTDFEAADAARRIGELSRHRLLKGLRPMIQDIADPEWMLRPDLGPAFEALEAHDLRFDALVLPHHLGNLLRLIRRHPALPVVVDHCAKPDLANGDIAGWKTDIAAIARNTGAWCKLSGLVTEAGPGWSVESLRPCVDHVLECFGPERLIWGSDWPVCTLAADYAAWMEATHVLLAGCSASEAEAILGGNAIRFYGLTLH